MQRSCFHRRQDKTRARESHGTLAVLEFPWHRSVSAQDASCEGCRPTGMADGSGAWACLEVGTKLPCGGKSKGTRDVIGPRSDQTQHTHATKNHHRP
jgi:hypothetical protein